MPSTGGIQNTHVNAFNIHGHKMGDRIKTSFTSEIIVRTPRPHAHVKIGPGPDGHLIIFSGREGFTLYHDPWTLRWETRILDELWRLRLPFIFQITLPEVTRFHHVKVAVHNLKSVFHSPFSLM